ncbi:hypothetical protein ACSQ67_007457 [Phaseolus vulgaris]
MEPTLMVGFSRSPNSSHTTKHRRGTLFLPRRRSRLLAFDDPRGKLFKLTRPTTVTSLPYEFEALANRLEGLSDAIYLAVSSPLKERRSP